jgi:hypothetical protein
MRLRAHDQYTSSTLIGGKGGAGPSSLHTTLEGPMEYVNARWMYSLHGFLPTWHQMDHVSSSLDYFQRPPLGDRPNIKHETVPLHTLTTVALLYFYHV